MWLTWSGCLWLKKKTFLLLDRFLFSATQRLWPIWIIYCTTSVDVIWWNRKLWNINLRGIWKKKFKATSLIYFFYGREWKHAPHIKMFRFEWFYIGFIFKTLKNIFYMSEIFMQFFLKKVLLIKETAYFMHLTKSKDKKKRISQTLGVWSLPPPFPSKFHSDRKCLNRFVSDSSVALCNWYRSLFTRCCKVENQIMKVSFSALCDSD